MESRVFFGGMPYGPDVKRLEEAFPVNELVEGRVIQHTEISAVIEQKRGTSRYYGVVNSWLLRVRNSNGVFMVWLPGDGLKVLNPAEILDRAETLMRQKMRQTARAVQTFGWVDRNRLDEMGKRRLDHQVLVARAIKQALDEKRRELAIELAPVRSLPKVRIA